MNIELKDKNGITLNTAEKYCVENIVVTPNLQEKTITENGTVYADEGYCGISSVTVQVSDGGTTEVTSPETMASLLTTSNAGKVYKYEGTTDSQFINGDLYQVEQLSSGYTVTFTDEIASSDLSSLNPCQITYLLDGETTYRSLMSYDDLNGKQFTSDEIIANVSNIQFKADITSANNSSTLVVKIGDTQVFTASTQGISVSDQISISTSSTISLSLVY